MRTPGSLVLCLGLLLGLCNATIASAQHSLTENFSSTSFEDTIATTADWNTALGELRMVPFEPHLQGWCDTPGDGLNLAISGNWIYIADGSAGIQVIDVTDVENPTISGSYDTPGTACGVAVTGNIAVVADGNSGLRVLDIANPVSPVSTGTCTTSGYARGVAVAGDLALVADDASGLQVIDISDPSNPVVSGTFNTVGTAYGVAVKGDLAFVADGENGLQIIDISDSTSPSLVGGLDTPGRARDVAVAGDLAVVADGKSGTLQLIDITDPASPSLLSAYSTPGLPQSVVLAGNFVLVADLDSGLQMVDITNPTIPSAILSVDTPGSASGIVLAGDVAFVADGYSGMQTIVVRNLISPTLTESGSTTFIVETIAVDDNLAVIGTHSDMYLYDITDPTNPSFLGMIEDAYPTDISIAGDIVFITSGIGLKAIDISDPEHPVQIGFCDTSFYAGRIDVSGDLAVVNVDNHGLYLIDITDPSNPVIIGSIHGTFLDPDLGLQIEGNLLYWGETNSFAIYDIKDPTNPIYVGSHSTPSACRDISVDGDHVFVTAHISLYVFDVSDPSTPVLVGSVDAPHNLFDVAISGDRLFALALYGGLQVFDISNPALPVLLESSAVSDDNRDFGLAGNFAFVAHYGVGLDVYQVFQTEVVYGSDTGVSLPIDEADDRIIRARLTSSETQGLSWQLSADGGVNWQSSAPDNQWRLFAFPGDDFLWKSDHTWAPGLNPTVSELSLQWLNDFGPITAIEDVPDDQGGWVYLHFTRSGYDFAEEDSIPVVGYDIFQRVDASTQTLLKSETTPATTEQEWITREGTPAFAIPGARTFTSNGVLYTDAFPQGSWALVASVFATQSEHYTVKIPTSADSTSTGIAWNTFLVTTHTTTPSIWFACHPDSGYSVDNIAPGVPQGVTADYEATGVTLNWDDAPESDFQFYRVYRNTDPEFVPTMDDLVQEIAVSDWTDPVENPWHYSYKITTVDHSGNESEAASPMEVTGADTGNPPARTVLLQPTPNPFNPLTTLSFETAEAGRVRLRVYDPAGRRVKTLVDEFRDAGRYQVSWDGRDRVGRICASGVYFFRFETGTTVQTRRATLVK